uniref:Uncharacterized protein n=1 Tax=Podoviridae sp. ct3k57 TaxID=2825217 RepID=A0A8S5Q104_9CAUD|nr:MAG TPA: hypothetical protein [Podoviridae sp. ct3k57]
MISNKKTASVLSPERAVFNISADDHHAFY